MLHKIFKIPKILMFLILLNIGYGIVILYSAGNSNMYPWAFKQLSNVLLFIPIMLFVATINTSTICKYSYVIYFGTILLLLGVTLFGHNAMGGQRWLNVFGLTIQPSELSKLSMVLFIARYFYDRGVDATGDLYELGILLCGIALPAVLVVKQPDLGTGMVIMIISTMMMFCAGVRMKYFIAAACAVLLASPILWYSMYDYQRKRIEVFLNPDSDRLGAGYNILQSKIAIGSGGLFGQGLGEGTQSHLDFLPEHHTDFIFACLAEDLGFVGVIGLIILYLLIIFASCNIAIRTKNIFDKLLVVGIASIFFSHIFINIGMVSGILPVVGIPLPFISYGRTMTGSLMIGFGLIMGVYVHQRK